MTNEKQKLYLPREGTMAIVDALTNAGFRSVTFDKARKFAQQLQNWDMLIIGKDFPNLQIVDDWGADLEVDMIDAAIGKIELKKNGEK